jgi:hypothetical protein
VSIAILAFSWVLKAMHVVYSLTLLGLCLNIISVRLTLTTFFSFYFSFLKKHFLNFINWQIKLYIFTEYKVMFWKMYMLWNGWIKPINISITSDIDFFCEHLLLNRCPAYHSLSFSLLYLILLSLLLLLLLLTYMYSLTYDGVLREDKSCDNIIRDSVRQLQDKDWQLYWEDWDGQGRVLPRVSEEVSQGWNRDFGLPYFRSTRQWISVYYMPPSLQHFVMAALEN